MRQKWGAPLRTTISGSHEPSFLDEKNIASKGFCAPEMNIST